MISFKSFITEASYKGLTLPALEKATSEALNSKYITNPDYNQLKSAINYIIEKAARDVDKVWDSLRRSVPEYLKHTKINSLTDYDNFNLLSDLFSIFMSANDVLFLKKKIEKAKSAWGPKDQAIIIAEKFYEEYYQVSQNLKDLKQYIVKVTVIRAEKKASQAIELKQKFTDSRTLIDVLETYKEEYKKKAGEFANDRYEFFMNNLKEYGWDINKTAPEPSINSYNYREASEKRTTLLVITDDKEPNNTDKLLSTGRFGSGPQILRKPSIIKKKKFVKLEIEAAGNSYDNWVGKMVVKIGKPVTQATFIGDPWRGSNLKVTTSDGEIQEWKTKVIINYSKYGTAFHQFPSHKLI